MTPRQKQIIAETFPLIREIAIPVSLLFYGRLFDLDPSLRRLFTIDMKEQSKKLIAMLEAIVASIDKFRMIVRKDNCFGPFFSRNQLRRT